MSRTGNGVGKWCRCTPDAMHARKWCGKMVSMHARCDARPEMVWENGVDARPRPNCRGEMYSMVPMHARGLSVRGEMHGLILLRRLKWPERVAPHSRVAVGPPGTTGGWMASEEKLEGQPTPPLKSLKKGLLEAATLGNADQVEQEILSLVCQTRS
jgi:hypothetical protein